MSRVARDTQLSLHLPSTSTPLRQRIAEAIVGEIAAGRLQSNDILPSSRALATALEVSRAPVVEAYEQLAAAGFIISRPGSGTRVAIGAEQAAAACAVSDPALEGPLPRQGPRIKDPQWDLHPEIPDTSLISSEDWRRSWRAAAAASICEGIAGVEAHPELRRSVAEHVRRVRGIAARPDDVVIFPSVDAVLRTIVDVAELSGRNVAFEEPGSHRARMALQQNGVRVRAIVVDDDGLDPQRLAATDRAVYCTPAHQFPLGSHMPVTRRAALVEWATASDNLIIEDDYDSELRFDAAPVPALRGLVGGDDRVAYIGSASKILTPSVPLAWLLAPRALRTAIDKVVRSSSEMACGVAALALSNLFDSGAMGRHISRSTRRYRARRTAFVESLQAHLSDLGDMRAAVVGIEAGLHVVLRLPDSVDDVKVAEDLGERGVSVPSLAEHRLSETGPRGLVCGYARLPERNSGQVARMIAEVLSCHML
ncbi:PLP-dependent aminotransferase family protein [Rhodococcus sp. ABRD24]|uniref:MocR-like pyridoxine biosynthesis transcription factor PdxR n=1 Tax=Rhodococcus sp. ABRD24 TaxID=2507582 RepID=UPI00103AE157|nr:PLP-dependent aminotransferase family protein [Rhodococcus sp. ABRD24]QBJ96763.1 PLP-dependent aminotransferase family protein [Rhodococcus sp. ABRD24]